MRRTVCELGWVMWLQHGRESAVLVLGLDASQPATSLAEEHRENYRILHEYIRIQDLHILAPNRTPRSYS